MKQISISPRLPETAGQTVAVLAKARGCDPIDQICDHLIADGGATRVLITLISAEAAASLGVSLSDVFVARANEV